MKKILLLVTLVAGVGILTGCVGLGFDDYGKYGQAMSDHSSAEAARIAAQADAIMQTAAAAGGSENEKLLLSVIAMLQIEQLQPIKLNIEPPVTGFGVLNNLVNKGPLLAGFAGMGYVAAEAYEYIGGTEISGQVLNFDRSFNPVEAHATGSGTSTTVPYMTSESTSYPVQ